MKNKYLKNNSQINQQKISELKLSEVELSDIYIYRSGFKNVNILNSELRGFEFVFAVLDICNFANTEFENLYFKQSSLLNSKVTGADFAEVVILNSKFNDSKLDLSNFKL